MSEQALRLNLNHPTQVQGAQGLGLIPGHL